MGDVRGLGARDEWAFSWRLPRLGYIVSKLRKHHGGDEVSTPMLHTTVPTVLVYYSVLQYRT